MIQRCVEGAFAWFAAVALMTVVRGAELPLIVDGEPRAVIWQAAAAAPCVGVAVRELRDYLRRMSAADVPVRILSAGTGPLLQQGGDGAVPIFVGASRFTRDLGIEEATLPSEGFVIDVRSDGIAIVGHDGDSYGENYRFMTASAGTLYGVYAFLESLGVRWYYPDERGTLVPSRATVRVSHGRRTSAPFFSYRHNGYGEYGWGRRIGAGGDRDIWSTRHTCSIHLHERCREIHPEWFFRNADGNPGHQADLARPEVVQAIASMAAKRFETRRPGQRYYLVIPLDGRAEPRDDGRSDWVGSAVVQVAERLRETHPSGRIVYCAYNDYRQPPKTLARLPPNVVVLIAQSRSALLDAPGRERAYDLVRAWQQRRPESIAFCRYGGNRLGMMPALIPRVIAADLRQLAALSREGPCPIVGEMNFVSVRAGSPFSWWEHLNEYVAAKCLWDPDGDVEALLEEFRERFFGAAAEPMRRYIDLCEHAYVDPSQRDLFALDTVDALGQYIDQARTLAQDTAAAEAVAFFEQGYRSLARIRSKLTTTAQRPLDPRQGVVCHLTFDEDTDAETVRDRVSGRSYAIRGGTWIDGVRGRALSFAGADAGVSLGAIDLSDTDYTLEAWVKPRNPQPGRAFIVGPDAWERHLLMIEFGLPTDQGHSGRLVLKHRRWEGGENLRLKSAPFEFLPDTWVHVAGTFSKTDGMAVYINGKLAGLDMNLTTPSDMSVFWIGASGQGATQRPDDTFGHFPGGIDEIRIARRELSAMEIAERARAFR